ncbi:MAG TPA: hypothetical protein H9958_06610 [Candidatus Limosilactobacillus intestinavium]|nr:hypothetical protein [Candidatus Limosilactobacillus intestinavium]
MEPAYYFTEAELLKHDQQLITDTVNTTVHKILKELGIEKEKPYPDTMSGKEIIDLHFCGIGSYATLKRRIDDIKINRPDLLDEVVIEREGQLKRYDSENLKAWCEGRLAEKEARKKIDPRTLMKRKQAM